MVTIEELFQSKQREMAAKMESELSHATAQGDNTETAWLDFLKSYLPKRYSCDKAFVIDSQGNISDQLDVVIYDLYFSPLLFDYGNNKYITAESVYAVFEVKPELNKKNFEYAGEKVASVRRLVRTSAPVLCNGKECPGREPFPIMGGLLTIHNGWKSKLTGQKINVNDHAFLDIGCCVNGESWIYKKNSDGIHQYVWSKGNSLLTFFCALLNELQIRGTVPAMEVLKYYDGFSK